MPGCLFREAIQVSAIPDATWALALLGPRAEPASMGQVVAPSMLCGVIPSSGHLTVRRGATR